MNFLRGEIQAFLAESETFHLFKGAICFWVWMLIGNTKTMILVYVKQQPQTFNNDRWFVFFRLASRIFGIHWKSTLCPRTVQTILHHGLFWRKLESVRIWLQAVPERLWSHLPWKPLNKPFNLHRPTLVGWSTMAACCNFTQRRLPWLTKHPKLAIGRRCVFLDDFDRSELCLWVIASNSPERRRVRFNRLNMPNDADRRSR